MAFVRAQKKSEKFSYKDKIQPFDTSRVTADLAVAFQRAIECSEGGIGTLSEKLIHKTLKYYIEPNDVNHEVKYASFVADIVNENGITEIQSASFQYLCRKLGAFLPFSKVTLVCPIQNIKYLTTVFPDGHTERKKSPRHKGLSDVAIELYKIREFIGNENLTVKLLFLEIEAERHTFSGKSRPRYKKGIAYPTDIIKETTLKKAEDYRIFLPDTLCENFTSKEFYKAIGARAKFSYYALKLCEYFGFISAVGKSGNAIIYQKM